jgi:tetratricopeptide (TPR) repeat protein
MVRRTKFVFALLVAGLVLAPVAAQAQEMGRFRVLIPDFEALQGANDDFGKDAAKELRELINTLATHQSIEKKEIEQNLKRFKMKMEELDCIRTRQLASQIDAQVALCASYTEATKDQFVVNASFWDIAGGEEVKVEQTQGVRKQEEDAARSMFDQFDRYVQQIRFAQFCAEYAQSQQWDNALRNCDQALELNPNAAGTRYQRARILYDSERYPEALEELERVLELNQFHEGALQLAGWISAAEGQDDQARDYYGKYLELNPSNASVRMKIAYDLAQAGDPVGAMQFIQVGLDVDPENADLWEQYGGFAFSAALEIQQTSGIGAENGGGVAPEAVEYFRKAIEAYEKVFAVKGADTPVGHLRNIIAAYVQLNDLQSAITMAERALETHSQEDAIWSIYADALQRTDRLDDAIAALDRVKEINPSYPNVSLRQGNWLIQAGRVQDAVAVLREAVAGDSNQADVAARLIFADAYANGVQKNRYDYAVSGITAAKQLPDLGSMMSSQLNFWHAYSLYQGAVKEQEPQTLQTAQATLPKFQQALRLFGLAGEYAASQPSITLEQFQNNTNTYIEIQEAIIKRGR